MFKDKKGQVGLGDAPTVVMIVGFVFLVMATIAYVGAKYGDAMDATTTVTVVNETVTQAERNLATVLDGALTNCNPETFTITNVTNGTGNLQVLASNYTLNTATGAFQNTSGLWGASPSWRVSYTYLDSGTSCDVARDLETEISNNTSIAGIVLTISLVGIVLSVLVGIFLAARKGGM